MFRSGFWGKWLAKQEANVIKSYKRNLKTLKVVS
jgi:hypothetical protein